VIVVYYILLSNGEEAARFGRIPPWVAMWAPNVLLAGAGLFLLIRRNQDKSLLLSRIDRWVRQDLWSGLLHLDRLRRKKKEQWRQERERREERRGGEQRERRGGPVLRPGVVFRFQRPRILFPSLLDRYVVRLFSMVFGLVLFSGLALFIIFDLSDLIDEILKNKVPKVIVFSYYKYLSLQMFYDIAPVVVLVTTLMTFSLLARSNEITALKALGPSLYRLSLPALGASLLVT